MRFLRRRKDADDPIRKGFGRVASSVDHAQRSLIAAVPTSRDPGIPLGDAIAHFLAGLNDAEAAMQTWKDDSVAHEWTKCSDALGAARAAAEKLKNLNIELTFEQLNAQIGDVLYPLEAFVDAESRLRRR